MQGWSFTPGLRCPSLGSQLPGAPNSPHACSQLPAESTNPGQLDHLGRCRIGTGP